jgi:hypothetical protein
MSRRKNIFVAMPFRPELNFFFLFLKRHLEEAFGIAVERGDARVLTKPLMEKIRDQILRADLIIGDVTDNNPNVFYELGLAHANGKAVIFLTQNPPQNAPVDIRQFEFIEYDLSQHVELLGKIDNAVQAFFGGSYGELFEEARILLQKFNADTGLGCAQSSIEEFQAKVMRGEQTGGMPPPEEEALRAQFLLPKVIGDFTDPVVIRKYTAWIGETFK